MGQVAEGEGLVKVVSRGGGFSISTLIFSQTDLELGGGACE